LVHFFRFWYHVKRKIWQLCGTRQDKGGGRNDFSKANEISFYSELATNSERCTFDQGDQIRRNFVNWAIISDILFISIDKNGVGFILGDFFRNLIWSPCFRHTMSTGRPDEFANNRPKCIPAGFGSRLVHNFFSRGKK
jgi:hypothetical protein